MFFYLVRQKIVLRFDWQGELKNLSEIRTLEQSPAIILIRPQLGENIGAVARAMLNFGFWDLRIVCPRDGWPNQHAIAVASGAGKILDNTKIFNSSEEACADLNFIFATTARRRGLLKETYSPNSAAVKSDEIMSTGLGVGFMFGPERSGLPNEDISLAQAIMSVPINPKFSSLNLAQCVLLVAYECFNLRINKVAGNEVGSGINYASLIEVDHLRLALFKDLSAANYFWPHDKRASLTENLTNLLGRLALTSADVRTLHGVIRALAKCQIND